jgi:catechol 2,3-dioxygenase-like lactoylglutathione lyase family enzyme
MLYEGIDHVALACGSADAAAVPFERLGLKVSPPVNYAGSGATFRFVAAGGPQNLFWILLTGTAVTERTPAYRLGLRVPSIDASLRELARVGIQAESRASFGPDDAKLGDFAELPASAAACAKLTLVEYVHAQRDRYTELEREGLLAHSLTLKRLDHVATVAPELEATTRYWNDALGVPTWGEVVTPTTVIRQMRVGDAIVELLGPAGPESPLRSRRPGLTGTVAFEVADLDAAASIGRAAGFSVSDPAAGSLPGTRVARFAADELSGLNLQLLEYV